MKILRSLTSLIIFSKEKLCALRNYVFSRIQSSIEFIDAQSSDVNFY